MWSWMQLVHTHTFVWCSRSYPINQSSSYCWICSSQVRGPEVKSALTGSCHFLLQVSPLCSGRGWAEFLLTLIQFFSFYSLICLGLYFCPSYKHRYRAGQTFARINTEELLSVWRLFLAQAKKITLSTNYTTTPSAGGSLRPAWIFS